MIQNYSLVHLISQEHFFFQYLRQSFVFISGDNFNPFFETLPFSKKDKEVIFTNFVKSLDFIKPFLNRNELSRFWVNKLADPLATKSVVVLYLLVYDLWVRHDLHIVVVVLILSDHIDEFVSCQLFLPDHLEKGCNLVVGDLNFSWMGFWGDESWR